MAVGALEPKFYQELISKLGFSYEEAPQMGDNEVREKFRKKFLEKTQDEWVEVSFIELTDVNYVYSPNVDRLFFLYWVDFWYF